MAVSQSREIAQSPLYIGEVEVYPFTLSFDGFVPEDVTALTDPVVTMLDVTDGDEDDVSNSCLTGTAIFTNLLMSGVFIENLDRDHVYILKCQGEGGGGTYEQWASVFGER